MKDQNKKAKEIESEENPIDNRIAAVRDLIFGENIQQYDQDFKDVYQRIKDLENQTNTNLNALSEDLNSRLDELQKSLESIIDNLRSDMNEKIEELDDAKADRRKLGKALEKIGSMLQE